MAYNLVERRRPEEGNDVVVRRRNMGGGNGREEQNDAIEEAEEDNLEYDMVRNSGCTLLPLPALPTSQEQIISCERETGVGGGLRGGEGRGGEEGDKSPSHPPLAAPNTGGGGNEEGMYVVCN